MKKDLSRFLTIAISALFIYGIIYTVLLFTKKEDSVQIITLINPEPGIHVIEIPTNKMYIQLKIGNYFEEGEETKWRNLC